MRLAFQGRGRCARARASLRTAAPLADHADDDIEGERSAAKLSEERVGGLGKVMAGVDESAVEVEYDKSDDCWRCRSWEVSRLWRFLRRMFTKSCLWIDRCICGNWPALFLLRRPGRRVAKP